MGWVEWMDHWGWGWWTGWAYYSGPANASALRWGVSVDDEQELGKVGMCAAGLDGVWRCVRGGLTF